MESLLRAETPSFAPLDKENRAYTEGGAERDGVKEAGKAVSITVTTPRHSVPVASLGTAEPLSPSKRCNISGEAFLPPPASEHSSADSTSDRAAEAKRQICFDYTKGVCKRGGACKYSHDVEEIVRVNSQERGVCFDFLRNSCQRGLLCRFSHDLSSIVVQDQAQKPGRKNAPICYDFVKGVCKRDDCRYSHDIFSIIRGRHAGSGPEICYDFTRGKCNRGNACRYSHDLQKTDGLHSLTTDAVAALATRHALATATAMAVEASRRQSAPGCLQGVPDPLLGLLGNPTIAPAASTLADASGVPTALALQLHSQWIMQLQAQAAASLLQSPAGPALPPGWDPLQQPSGWHAGLPPLAAPPGQTQPHGFPEPRRHTHDGAAIAMSRQAQDALFQQLADLNMRQALSEQPAFGAREADMAGATGPAWSATGVHHTAGPLPPPPPPPPSRSASLPQALGGPGWAEPAAAHHLADPRGLHCQPGAASHRPMTVPPIQGAATCQPASEHTSLHVPGHAQLALAGTSVGLSAGLPPWQAMQSLSLHAPSQPPAAEMRLPALPQDAACTAAFDETQQPLAGDQLAIFQEIWRQ